MHYAGYFEPPHKFNLIKRSEIMLNQAYNGVLSNFKNFDMYTNSGQLICLSRQAWAGIFTMALFCQWSLPLAKQQRYFVRY